MKFSILTLFPEMFDGLLSSSILHRAQSQGHIQVERVQIRDFALDRHRSVDDYSFGGGPGMVLKVDVMERALNSVIQNRSAEGENTQIGSEEKPAPHVVYLSPQGSQFSQETASRLAEMDHLVLVCGHYEGIDERFVESCVDEELSLGDFVLTGGEIPAMAVVDAVARLRPGVLGDSQSFRSDSFYASLLDHPHYTRPARWQPESVGEGLEVGSEAEFRDDTAITPPDVLLSGNHVAVEGWRRRQALLRTLIRRPDLLATAELSRGERKIIDRLVQGLAQDLDDLSKRECG
jgi:tRNA (guanine37-N1)-methyltransferase